MDSTRLRHTVFFTLLITLTSSTVICFGHLLQLIVFTHAQLPSFTILFSGFAGLITYTLYQKWQTKISLEIARLYTSDKRGAAIPIIHIPLLIFTTLLSHFFGASVGREGVAVQIGGTFGSFFSHRKKHWQINVPNRVIIATGMATGFAALFGMPLTATLFTIEVTKLYTKIARKWLLLPLIGSLVAAQFSSRFGLAHMHFHVSISPLTPAFFYAFLLLIFLILIAATLYLLLHHTLSSFIKAKVPSPFFRISIGAFFLSCVLYLFQLDQLQGLGTTLITASFTEPTSISFFFPFLKIIFTLGFLALGFKGGEVTPIFSIGAMLGAISANTFHLPTPLFAIVGLAAFFGTTTKTYLTPLLLIAEVTTPLAAPFVIPLIIILHFLTPKIGIYQTVFFNRK